MKIIISLTILISVFILSACEQSITRNFGGHSTQSIPAGTTLMNITWKQDNMWILYHDPKTGNCVFQESSNMGILQGSVTIPNCK